MADVNIVSEKRRGSMENLTKPESNYLVKRRNTEKLPESLDPFRCRQDNHSYQSTRNNESCLCTKRRHTLAPGVSQKEFFEKETKLIVLEFLKVSTPRFKFEHKFKKFESSTVSGVVERNAEEKETDISSQPKKSTVKKRETKKQRKVSGNKSKTVTLGEKERQEICELENKHMKNRYKRSSSDLTSQQYHMMKRKCNEMQLPIIQWLEEHIESTEESKDNQDNTLIIPKITTTTIHDEPERSSRIEHELLLRQDASDNISVLPRRPRGLTLNIPRRSIALQLIESNIFTPETMAVQKLEKISEEIIRDYGDILAASMIDLLNPIRTTNSITYIVFSKVAKKVYNFATKSSGTLARLAMVLNLVKETMVEGNLNEEQLELLVDYSTKFFTENADESPLKEGKGWVELGLSATNADDDLFPTIQEYSQSSSEDDSDGLSLSSCSSSDETEEEQDENNAWAPYGIAAFTFGIGLAYTCMRT